VEQMDATTLLLAGQTAFVDPYLNLIVEEREGDLNTVSREGGSRGG
jgi:hypothetical protein